jgi:hypothetical protein
VSAPPVAPIEKILKAVVDNIGAVDQAIFLKLDIPVALLACRQDSVARIIHEESGGATDMLVPTTVGNSARVW